MSTQPIILYVEDEPNNREIVELLVREVMILPHLTIFEDSDNFLERFKNLDPQPNIVLLDIHVKPLDGFEMLAQIRSIPEYASIPVLALTASVMNEEVDLLWKAGFNEVIAKPVDMETFPDTINRIVERGV